MSIFNPHATQIEAYIQRENRRRAREVEEVAIEALQIGLAFSDEDDPGVEEETFIESPQFDAALQAFAQMEQQG